MNIKFRELTSGDRFYAYGSLWTRIQPGTARRHGPESIALKERGYGYIGDGICSFEEDELVKFIPPVQLNCPNCGNNRQVWVNQITHKLTCHRVGCNNLELE